MTRGLLELKEENDKIQIIFLSSESEDFLGFVS